jgi:phosphatidylglycerol---prolipoprotein diacylglyceryl transferase
MMLVACSLAVAGAAAAAVTLRARCRGRELSPRAAVDALFVIIAAGLLAGHAADVVLYRPAELARSWTAILPGSGGACSLGALAGGGLAGWVWLRRRAQLWQYADELAVALSLGWGIARLGCFATHDHLGAVTASPLGVAAAGAFRHDLGLYEAILALGICGALVALGRRPPGMLAAAAAVLFAGGRFAIERWRVDDPRYLGLTLVQYVMPVLATVGAACFLGARPARSAEVRQDALGGVVAGGADD